MITFYIVAAKPCIVEIQPDEEIETFWDISISGAVSIVFKN